MATGAGDTRAASIRNMSPSKMSTRSTNKKPGTTTLRLVNLLCMEIPMSAHRPNRLNWHFISPHSFKMLPPWITPDKTMTPEQRKTEFVATHRTMGMMKLCVFARLLPGIEKQVACAHANAVVATFERILVSDDVVDGIGTYNATVDRYGECMEKDQTYQENEPPKTIDWKDAESQSLLDEDNVNRYDNDGHKEAEWEWHEEPTDGAKKVPAAKSPAKSKSGGGGRGGGKGGKAAGSGSGSGGAGGGTAQSGSGGGGKKPPGEDGKKKPAGGKKRAKRGSDSETDSDTGKSSKSGSGKRTPKKKTKKTKKGTTPPTAGTGSDSDESQSVLGSQRSQKSKDSNICSKPAVPHKGSAQSKTPSDSSDSDSQDGNRTTGKGSSEEDVASTPAVGATQRPYDIATASRYQKKKMLTDDIKCHPKCGCLALNGEAAVINSISPNLMPCELTHRQMIYQKLLNRGVREKLSKQSKKIKSLESRLKAIEENVKETKEYSKVTAEDKKFKTEREKDLAKFGKPCSTFTEFMMHYEEDFELVKRMLRYVPTSKEGKHFIKDAMEQFFGPTLVCRLYSEKTGKDKIQYTNSGKMFMYGEEYFKIPYGLEVAMQDYAASKYKLLQPEDFREKFLSWLESQRKIRKIHIKNYLKSKLTKPGYHAIHSAVWWDTEKKKGVFDSPAPLWDDVDNQGKSEWYQKYKAEWLETVEESASIPDSWKGSFPDYLDSTYVGYRALHAKKPTIEPYWD